MNTENALNPSTPGQDSGDTLDSQIAAMKPRFVDIWVLPALVMYAGWKSRDLNRWTRRMLFAGGIYMIYRNWTTYKQVPEMIASLGKQTPSEGASA